MTAFRLSLYEDSYSPGAWAEYMTGGSNRLLFCIQGSAGLGEIGSVLRQEAAVCPGLTYVTTGHDGAVVWRWELCRADDEDEIEGAGVTSRLLGSGHLNLDEDRDYLFRCESLGLPPGDSLPPHRLMGPSLTLCMQGEIETKSGDVSRQYSQFDAWYDAGRDLISIEAHDEQPSLMLRGMLLSPVQAGERSSVGLADNGPDDGKSRFEKIHAEGVIAI
ncbi:hypothetical protein [Aestuariispira ectoiniformans]|uniref:hypothetical protein n=1 Tax=Aestuariispira ectoiniformans TaxID=2775080 RepID=UPI00223C2388|nr:hypothetical protein [Aestuariispira ectoiniformans]